VKTKAIEHTGALGIQTAQGLHRCDKCDPERKRVQEVEENLRLNPGVTFHPDGGVTLTPEWVRAHATEIVRIKRQ
jgi:hypothetical protein